MASVVFNAFKRWLEEETKMTEEVRFPIQMVLPTDEIEVPWGDVPSLPLEVIADTEPDEDEEGYYFVGDMLPKGADTGENPASEKFFAERADPSHWSNHVLSPEFLEANERAARIYDKTWIPRHPSSERFHEILSELGDMHDEKSEGYGTDEDPLANVRASSLWGMPSWVGAMLRAHDKIIRLQNYAQKGELPFEKVEDAFKDLAVYSVIGLVLLEQEQNVRP